ncbi:hypothetical protein [Desulfosarcina sp.]|uniref:hypothetical protein n=1 Tax=Desulfosarcina sp. TaxID=2027861 RepID=UPI003970DB3C
MIPGAVLCLAVCGCTPAAIKYSVLTPNPGDGLQLCSELARTLEGVDAASLDMQALSYSVMGLADSTVWSFTAAEYEDLLVVDVYVYNLGHGEASIDPSELVLVDGNRLQMKRLEPSEAANLLLAQTKGAAPLMPQKYSYTAATRFVGDSAYTTITPHADPYTDLGNSLIALGNSMAAEQNQKLMSLARWFYDAGLIDGTTIASDAAFRGLVYWQNTPLKGYPLELRLARYNWRVCFAPTIASSRGAMSN